MDNALVHCSISSDCDTAMAVFDSRPKGGTNSFRMTCSWPYVPSTSVVYLRYVWFRDMQFLSMQFDKVPSLLPGFDGSAVSVD